MNQRLSRRAPLSMTTLAIFCGVASLTAPALASEPAPKPAQASGSPAAAQTDPPAPPAAGPANDAPGGASGAAAPAPGPVPAAETGSQPNQVKDEAQAAAPAKSDKEEKKLPFRNSTLLFDQSMTTQTAHLETSPQQSYVPLYEWWVSFRPRWYFSDHVYYSLRADLYKEIGTKAEETDKYQEDVIGDIWNTLAWKTPLAKEGSLKNTTVGLSGLVKLPTSKESQTNGVYVIAGAGGSVAQKIPINGEDAGFLNEAHIGLAAQYQHPFTKATTPTGLNNYVQREDVDGRSFFSDQVRGSTLTNHTVIAFVDTGLQLTPKLGLTADMIFINNWHYAPTGGVTVPTATGSAGVPRSGDSTLFAQSTWFLAELDYDLLDEVSLGLGYYNLQNVIAPDGQRRSVLSGDNVWWSPDARVYFDITMNLDKIYETAAGIKHDDKKKAASNRGPQQRANMIQQQQQL